MAIKITLDSFLAVIKRSGLLVEEQLNDALEKFRAANGSTIDGKPFAEYLVRNKQLTVWQAEKVLQGKHKGFFLGRYRLLSLLGKGGMSSVYLAQHTVMKRLCALKVLPAKRVNDASYLGRFHREAQAVAALDHPNIVRAYDVDMATDGGIDIHFLAMEFVQGKSLLELVQEKGFLPVNDAAEMIRQSALGLDHAHRAGLVHRDIKPGNLLVTPTGTIKILDLGLARFFDDEDQSLTVQHDEKVLGTADYISPEQAIDSHKVDRRTDIYSLGCTLFFLLTGHPPFNSGSLAQRLVAHQTKPVPSITKERPEVPTALQTIMGKMTAKQQANRYQTAQEVADAITRWQQSTSSSTASAVATRTPQPSGSTAPVAASPPTFRPTSVNEKLKTSTPTPSSTPAAPRKPIAPTALNADPLGSFLDGFTGDEPSSQAVPVLPPQPQEQESSLASVDTANLNDSLTAVDIHSAMIGTDIDFMDDVFDPSRLNLDGLDLGEPTTSEAKADSSSGIASVATDQDTSPTTTTSRHPSPRRAIPTTWLIGGGAVIAILTLAIWSFLGGDTNPPTIAPETKPAKSLPAADIAVIEVGPQGHFTTISQAIDYVRANFRPLDGTERRTIQVSGGFTYPESIQIVSGGRNHFPRNVTLKSTGSQPAVIRGDGKRPALNIQETESLTIEGFVIDAHGAPTAIRVAGYSPLGKLQSVTIRNFTKTGLQLDDLASLAGEEFQLTGVRVEGQSKNAVGIRCMATTGSNTVCVQMSQLRVIGPLQSGLENSGTFWTSSITDSVFAECGNGIRFQNGTLIDVTLMNNTFANNEFGISWGQEPETGSRNLKLLHSLFVGNSQGDSRLERGSATGFAESLFAPGEGVRYNQTTRTPPDTNGVDLFSTDGQRGAAVSFVSTDPEQTNFLKPTFPSVNVATPANGAKGYVGAVPP